MYFNPLVIPVIVFSIVILRLAYVAWNRKIARGSRYFAILAISCLVYSLTYVLMISSTTLEMMLLWIRFSYLGIATIPAFYVMFALAYTGKADKLRAKTVAILFAIPLTTIILFNTNQYHELVYQNISLTTEWFFPSVYFDRGLWYWVQSAYASLAGLFSIGLFFNMWLNLHKLNRKSISVMLVGSVLPWLGAFFYLIRPFGWTLDLNPLLLTISGIFFYWGLKRYELFDIAPIARTKLFEDLPDGVIVLDNMMRVVDLNISAQEYLQADNSVVGKPVTEAIEDWSEMIAAISLRNKGAHFESQHNYQGKPHWFDISFSPLHEKGELATGQMIIMRDITEAKQYEEKLYLLSITDELTGLYNRRYFMEALVAEFKRAKRYKRTFSILMVDIDNFKAVNDKFGHNAGDVALLEISSILKSRLREADKLARLGGEEFGVLLPNTELESAYKLAEDIRSLVASSVIEYEGCKIILTVSIGVAEYRDRIVGIDDLLRLVDKALYKAKDKGRNCTISI